MFFYSFNIWKKQKKVVIFVVLKYVCCVICLKKETRVKCRTHFTGFSLFKRWR